MNDRTLGYGILATLLLFLISPAVYLIYKSMSPVETRTIEFDSVNSMSFLTKEDPVRIRGVEVGIVKSVYSHEMKTRVDIETRVPFKIYKGYNVAVTAKGFMGDRFISIDPGDSTGSIIDKNEILKGEFLLGPSEAIAYVNKLQDGVAKLDELTLKLKNGFGDSPSFISKFKDFTLQFDLMSDSILAFSKGLQIQCEKIDSLANFLSRMHSLTDTLSTSVPDILSNLDNLIRKTDTLVTKVDTLLDKSSHFVSKLSSPQSPIVKDYISALQKDLSDLRNAIKEIEVDGIRLPIRPW